MPNLTRGQIKKANKKHGGKFAPKYGAFSILQNKIEDVVDRSTKLWKTIYKLINDKDVEVDKAKTSEKEKKAKAMEKKIEEKKGELEKQEEKREEEKEDEEDKEKGEEEIQKGENMATAKQQ